jgi:predicted ribosome quality control (RQC) complex YloA/Tae2 family protein
LNYDETKILIKNWKTKINRLSDKPSQSFLKTQSLKKLKLKVRNFKKSCTYKGLKAQEVPLRPPTPQVSVDFNNSVEFENIDAAIDDWKHLLHRLEVETKDFASQKYYDVTNVKESQLYKDYKLADHNGQIERCVWPPVLVQYKK